ncbi:MAG: retropepsin-like aspartic protease [Bacteroidales bacterium]
MKKSLILLVILFTIYACGIFQGRIGLNQGGVSQESYYETIPFDYIKDKIILPITINGKTRRFIFDTGAPTIISEALQKELNYDTLRKARISDVNQNEDSVTFVKADHIFLGELEFNGIPAMVNDLKELPWACFKVDGFIGSNLLRNSVVQINRETKELVVASEITMLQETGTRNPMKLDRQSSPYLGLSLAGEKERYVLFDSGSDDFVNINRDYFETLQQHNSDFNIEKKGYGSGIMGMFGTGRKGRVYRVELDSLSFDQTIISDPIVEVTNTGNRVGAKLLRYGIVTLDYKNKNFYFLAPDKSIPFEKEQKADLGFRPVIRRDTFQVGLVWQNSLVDSLGLEPGNEIIRINEYNFQDSLEHSFCKAWLNDMLRETEVFDIRYIDEKGNFRRIKMRRKEK